MLFVWEYRSRPQACTDWSRYQCVACNFNIFLKVLYSSHCDMFKIILQYVKNYKTMCKQGFSNWERFEVFNKVFERSTFLIRINDLCHLSAHVIEHLKHSSDHFISRKCLFLAMLLRNPRAQTQKCPVHSRSPAASFILTPVIIDTSRLYTPLPAVKTTNLARLHTPLAKT
jgi:hypothetical protein